MRERKTTTIGAIMEQPSSTADVPSWVDDFEGVVRGAEALRTKTGGVFYKCLVVDPHNERLSLEVSGNVDLTKHEGRLCLFGGGGMRKGDYQGQPQVRLGKSSTVSVLGAGPGPGQAHRPEAVRSPGVDPSLAGHGPGQEARKGVLGVTVGMAINNAVYAVCERLPSLVPGTADWSGKVGAVASDILRMAGFFEAGNLVKPAGERGVAPAGAGSPADRRPPMPPPPETIPEDDIPF